MRNSRREVLISSSSLMVNDWEMTPWAYRAAELVLMAGGVWFRVVRAAVIIPADVNASVLHSAVLGGVVRPL